MPPRWFSALLTLSKAVGYEGMIEGQMRDIASEGIQLSPDDLESMHYLKTGALIEASIHTGAVLSGADPDNVKQLCQYARGTGLAFQVADDILNVEGDPSVLGKAVGTDSALEKNTYPSLIGLGKSKTFAKNLVDNALQKLEEGIRLARFCSEMLDETEKKVTMLTRDPSGESVDGPFSPDMPPSE